MSTPAQSKAAGWNLENSYAELPEQFFQKTHPEPATDPQLVFFHSELAKDLGFVPEALHTLEGARIFSGNDLPEGSDPIAQAYAGHQFGNFVILGDGRALLIGEQRTPDGRLFDLQWKGSGRTSFSRRGDGRAALGPMLREVLISEAMHAFGIPTTRSLAVAATGDLVYRETPLPGAILTRVASSHIRVGTFEFFAARRDTEALRLLVDYSIQRHYPHIEIPADSSRALELLRAVALRQAALIAGWMSVGFVHGVMNTDNVAISGETIDYGPCAFLDTYDPATVFSSIDHHGRYAFGNQPGITQWNLARFAEALLPEIDSDEKEAIRKAEELLHEFPDHYSRFWTKRMGAKFGFEKQLPGDGDLIQKFLDWLKQETMDFTIAFRSLADPRAISEGKFSSESFQQWKQTWEARLQKEGKSHEHIQESLLAANPAIIPRNHLVENALSAAVENHDFAPFHALFTALQTPFLETETNRDFRSPPPPSQRVYQTFCGT